MGWLMIREHRYVALTVGGISRVRGLQEDRLEPEALSISAETPSDIDRFERLEKPDLGVDRS